MNQRWILLLTLFLAGCLRASEPQVIYITATVGDAPQPLPGVTLQVVTPVPTVLQLPLSPVPDAPLSNPSPDPTRFVTTVGGAQEYIVQPGDTLFAIAQAHNVTIDDLLVNNPLADPNVLAVGQILLLPPPPDVQGSDFKIIPDSRLVRAPGSAAFDVAAFIALQPGYIRIATDEVDDVTYTAAELVQRVSLEFSVDPRLLLALLEYRAGWLSNPNVTDDLREFPMGVQEYPEGTERRGLYRQLAWTANELNRGYYSWKHRGMTALTFPDSTQVLLAPTLNAGTAGIHYFFSLTLNYDDWSQQVSMRGFYSTYFAYFGDPFENAIDPLVPPDLVQPEMTFPFPQGETWYYTGGPHGGWGSGSAWAAIDFAPPDIPTQPCYVSQFWATAVAPGIIARSDQGAVALDLDGDGDETTGFVAFYLHIASTDRVAQGTRVEAGDRIGHPSCEGGFSNATHMHFARRYNGEWLPASCDDCAPDHQRPPFVLSGWTVVALAGQEYEGFLYRRGDRRQALQGRNSTDNNIQW